MESIITGTGSLWKAPTRNAALEESLMKELGTSRLLASVLANRGFSNVEETARFLSPKLDYLEDPRLLPDYDEAIRQILGAKDRGETIYVHGDYDVDGVTSASLLYRFLRKIGCKAVVHVPHRMIEGYGIHESAVTDAIEQGAKLFLTCDCGANAVDRIAQAREAGMIVVVTDHHTLGDTLPNAHALVNPHRKDSLYPFKELSGVGVAFKLCSGIARELGISLENYYRAYLDLACLGTVADVMPLVGENRIIAKFGLERLRETKKTGLRALMVGAKLFEKGDRPLTTRQIGFVIGPRLNAVGRIDDAGLALKLLLSEDESESTEIAKKIEGFNDLRKEEQARIHDEAVSQIEAAGLQDRNVIVVGSEGWHSGVIGIVASRLVEAFRRPVFIMSIDPLKGIAKGSARSIPAFHLADAIRSHPSLFTSGGGHQMAAGFSLDSANIDALREALHAYAGNFLTPEDFLVSHSPDAEVTTDELSIRSVEELSQMEPFGSANTEPLFLSRGLRLTQTRSTRNPGVFQASFEGHQGEIIGAVMFQGGESLMSLTPGSKVNILYQPQIDEWQGNRKVKMILKDFYAT